MSKLKNVLTIVSFQNISLHHPHPKRYLTQTLNNEFV